jgi:hypothetical protein
MGLPMFRPLCKCINKYLSDVVKGGVRSYVLSRILVQAI